MKKNDRLCRLFNIVLGVAYIPFSIICFLLLMVSEATIGATNPMYIFAIDLFCGIDLAVMLLYPAGLFLSVWLRRKGYSTLSFVTQVIPLAIFILNMFFLFLADFIPAGNHL